MQRALLCLRPAALTAAALLSTALGAQAQSSSMGAGTGGPNTGRWSAIPYTSDGYVAIGIGQGQFSNSSCGVLPGLSCDDNSDLSGRLAIGGLFNRVFGVELAAIHFGTTDRAGGQTKAYAANLSLVARLPLASSFSLFGKVGATYGRTVVTATPGSLVPTGRSFGWGPSFGAGLSYDFNPIQSVVLEWEHHDLRFPGTGRQGVKNTTVGYVHRF
jgi:hypothetical protein